ncbi:hypothetical protein [Collimonas fungivorans]|uniref:hypothetical protein n=1 Tax=Collimonas fungivorans TaxID=158899 RepID=UPI0005A27BDD|nr:hypothetical protein [Collimonas fungivorans]
MDLVQLKIIGLVITHRYGTLSSGDILRTDAAYAKHLVEDCGAAEYIIEKPVETASKTVSTKIAKKGR